MGVYIKCVKTEVYYGNTLLKTIDNTFLGFPVCNDTSFSQTGWSDVNITSYYDYFTRYLQPGDEKYFGFKQQLIYDYDVEMYNRNVVLYAPFCEGIESSSITPTRSYHYLDETHVLLCENTGIRAQTVVDGVYTDIAVWGIGNPNFRPYTSYSDNGSVCVSGILCPTIFDGNRFVSCPCMYAGVEYFKFGIYAIRNLLTFPENLAIFLNTYANIVSDYDPDTSDDPFTPGGTTGGDDTETEGGTGDFDGEGDAIAEPELPSLSSTDSGFLSLFNPTLAQVQALGAFMWSENFVLDTFKKLFSDPMQAILGLSIVPVSPSATTTVSVVLGNVDTGVSMPLITNQYVHKELGTVTLSEYWGAYLDYSPYTKVEIYLPYIGVKTLNTDDVMGKTLKLSYNIDLLTGACVALLVVGGSLLYQFTGACASSVPITANDWTNVINGILSTAGKVAAVAMTGGLSSALLPGSVSSTASTVSSMKPTVEKSGTMQGMPGLLASDRPFLIVTRPRQALPTNQKHYTGYPSFVTRTLGSVTGYTVVDDIHLDGMTCTDTEKEEIRRLLKEGVIL